jgi:hypothetical protein
MSEFSITTIRSLLEADRDERRLERSGDAEDFFKMAMRKLRSRRHLGQLRLQEWLSLIDGARNYGYHVYLAVPEDRPPNSVNIKMLDRIALRGSHGLHAHTTIVDSNGNSMGWWEGYHTRPAINNSITPNSRLVLSQTDYTRVWGDMAIRGLGLEDVS